METNIWAVIVLGIVAMIVGAIWYGPLFGKKWMEIVGVSPEDLEARKKMQKSAGQLYVVQFILVLFQIWVLSKYLMGAADDMSFISNAIWIWAAFVMPTIAAGSMWNNDSAKVSWARFLIQAGYQLVMFVIFALVLSAWM